MSRQREENHFDGSEQRTTILDTAPAGIAQSIQAVELSMVARGGTEPPTRGFSIHVPKRRKQLNMQVELTRQCPIFSRDTAS